MEKTVVSIPKPCHEDWNSMSPDQQGRFCGSCEKIVFDFTNKTPLEIKETLIQSTGKVCGRFKKSDLDRPLEEPVVKPVLVPVKPSWTGGNWMKVAAVLTALFIGKRSNAQMQGQVMLRQADDKKKKDCAVPLKPTATIIHGQLKSTDPARGLSQVSLKVYSNGKEIDHTFEFNGGYVLTIPPNAIYDFKITLELNAVGFESKVLNDVPSLKDKIAIDILMSPLSDEVLIDSKVIFIPPSITSCYFTLGEPMIERDFEMGDLMVEREEVLGNVALVNPGDQKTKDTIQKETTLKKVDPDNYGEVKKEQRKERLKEKDLKNEKPPVTKVIVNLGADLVIKAYPNPGNGLFNVNLKGTRADGHQADVFVYNSNGQVVYTKKQVSDNEVIDIRQQPNGVYIIKAVQAGTGKTAQARVVKTS